MILADKIINERKKNGWSQEELAERLAVSRQAVSKWESAQATPDLQKIIIMAELFSVTTDYLLKDDIEPESANVPMAEVVSPSETGEAIRRVSLEEANDYIKAARENGPKIANGVSLCILSPVILILLAGLTEAPFCNMSETVAAVVGLIILLSMVAVAVFIFIVFGAKINKYEYIEKEVIETAYGVDGMAKDRKRAIEGKRTVMTAIGVILCILSSVPLLIAACLEMQDYIIVSMVSVLLIVVSIAVNMFVRIGTEWNCLEQLLQEGEFTIENKLSNKKVEKIAGIYWAVVLAGYLGWSFVTSRWDYTWIVWPVTAILFGAVTCIIKAIDRAR
ncbi:MAG: helix-turn-helix transcriptional regulator [Lachnospiraceae bacterium]|nr:helix-turn-helix transcriptional regulator [Lachnospiraceae bacterium]